jgi:hypothetical protein
MELFEIEEAKQLESFLLSIWADYALKALVQ